jgi:hypothetical protein
MTREIPAPDASELAWFKSSHSGGTNGESCVEIAISPETAAVHVRDSKDAAGPSLALRPDSWTHFVAYAASGH